MCGLKLSLLWFMNQINWNITMVTTFFCADGSSATLCCGSSVEEHHLHTGAIWQLHWAAGETPPKHLQVRPAVTLSDSSSYLEYLRCTSAEWRHSISNRRKCGYCCLWMPWLRLFIVLLVTLFREPALYNLRSLNLFPALYLKHPQYSSVKTPKRMCLLIFLLGTCSVSSCYTDKGIQWKIPARRHFLRRCCNCICAGVMHGARCIK